MSPRKIKRSGLLFGEGKTEYNFFTFLSKTNRFRNLEKDWFIEFDHASGASCQDVLDACVKKATYERSYETILCFIDTDKLLHDFPRDYEQKKRELESKASEHNVEIIWQETKHEEVIQNASNGRVTGSGIKRKLKLHEATLLRSVFVKTIFSRFPEH